MHRKRFNEHKEFILEWHGAAEVKGKRVIGRTPDGKAVALICEGRVKDKPEGVITHRIMDKVMDEAKALGLGLPVQIWASGTTAPAAGELYNLHQIAV